MLLDCHLWFLVLLFWVYGKTEEHHGKKHMVKKSGSTYNEQDRNRERD